MKIKELKRILDQAPDENRDVYIPHTIIMPTSGSVHQDSSTSIGSNFDDNNDLDLYVIVEEKRYCKICGDELEIEDDLVCGYHSME